MSNTGQTVHLVVEAGPDKGRPLSVPAGGARIGRSSSNDIVLADPSLSRFHCRFYFKDGRHLAVSDLASTNETLVNGQPAQDVRLTHGDRVEIGESTLKVTCDTLFPAAAPAPAPPGGTAPPPAPTPREIDLGLQPEPAAPAERAPMDGARLRRFLLVAAAAAALVAVAALGARKLLTRGPGTPAPAPRAGLLEIDYEKVEAHPRNIFRYALKLRGDMLSVRIDNLDSGRHVFREERVPETVRENLAQSIGQTGFFDLSGEYAGVVPEVWDLLDLTITLDRRVHRVRVLNRLEPDKFKEVRETIEEFARNQIGLYALALPPEKLQELARDAWLQGQKMFDEREVRYDNLARAIRSFSEVESLLETVEPKPDYYADAVAAREECKRLLSEKYEDFLFRAERAAKLREWREANDNLQIVLQLIRDRSDERYEKAYKKLLDVQRRLERR